MAMHIVARNVVFSTAMMPDMALMGECRREKAEKMEAIYRDAVRNRLYAWGKLTWFPEMSEIGAEGGTDIDPDEIIRYFESLSVAVMNDILIMDDDEIEAAYKNIQ